MHLPLRIPSEYPTTSPNHSYNQLILKGQLNNNEFDSLDDFEEIVEKLIDETEIIMYHTAMTFLRENDYSLQESLKLANDLWYKIEDLNSETLATILLKDYLRNELNDLMKNLKEELKDEEDE